MSCGSYPDYDMKYKSLFGDSGIGYPQDQEQSGWTLAYFNFPDLKVKMKSNKLLLTCVVLVLIVVISEAGNVMKKHSHPSRPRTSHRRASASRSNPDDHRLVRTNPVHKRKPAEASRSASPAASSGSRPYSPGASSMQNSQSSKVQRRKIPKIVITPPDNERPKSATKPVHKKVTFRDPLVNIKYIEPNPIRRHKSSKASLRTSG